MKSLTFLQQNDIHAQLEPHWEYFWTGGGAVYRQAGGLARAATVIRQVRAETGGACCLLDGGDAIHGTGPAQWTEGAVVVPALNALGITLMAPGNWEFGYGPEVLQRRAQEFNFPLLACNVHDAARGELVFAPTAVHEIGGVTVGFVGVATPIVTQTMPRKFGAGLRIQDPVEPVRAAVRRLRREERVDLIVVVSHVGLPQDIQLAHKIGDIDVLFSGHTHDRLTHPVHVGKTLVMQSGFSGSFLGRLDLTVTQGRVVDYRHRLITLNESIPLAPDVQAIIGETLETHRARLAEVVGATAVPLHRMTVLEAPMDDLITAAYRDYTGSEVAFSHGWRYGAPVPPGPITAGDLWQMIPTNPELYTTQLAGAEIRELLEDSLESVFAADPFAQRGGYLIRTAGVRAEVRINNPYGARVLTLEVAGAPCEPGRIYQAVGAGEQGPTVAAKQATGAHAIDVLGHYLAQGSYGAAGAGDPKFVAV
jgi:2',3'-cyclic-nucleotide 2'-phosphodiesterase (5'-nucleotidase family)